MAVAPYNTPRGVQPAVQVFFESSGVQVPVSGTDPLPITGTVTSTPPVLQNVNITQVNSAAVATGHGTASGALRVELPTDGTGFVGINGGTVAATQAGTWTIINNGGSVTLVGTSAVSGTVAATQSGTWTVQPGNTPNTTAWNVNQIDLLNTGYILGTSAAIRQTITINGTTAVTLAPAVASLTNYLTDLLVFRTDAGTTMAYITLNDAVATPYPLPPNGGAGPPIRVPIKGNGTNVAITATSQTGITGFGRVAGYTGT